jgi:hypothetical protein
MQLINKETGFVLVEYKKDTTIFHDRFLAKQMAQRGILIPPALRSAFENKQVIRLNDPLFQKAFKEVYFPLSIHSPAFEWID